MTSTEKIANAKKRIDELEKLIRYWNKSEEEVNGITRIQNKAA